MQVVNMTLEFEKNVILTPIKDSLFDQIFCPICQQGGV